MKHVYVHASLYTSAQSESIIVFSPGSHPRLVQAGTPSSWQRQRSQSNVNSVPGIHSGKIDNSEKNVIIEAL